MDENNRQNESELDDDISYYIFNEKNRLLKDLINMGPEDGSKFQLAAIAKFLEDIYLMVPVEYTSNPFEGIGNVKVGESIRPEKPLRFRPIIHNDNNGTHLIALTDDEDSSRENIHLDMVIMHSRDIASNFSVLNPDYITINLFSECSISIPFKSFIKITNKNNLHDNHNGNNHLNSSFIMVTHTNNSHDNHNGNNHLNSSDKDSSQDNNIKDLSPRIHNPHGSNYTDLSGKRAPGKYDYIKKYYPGPSGAVKSDSGSSTPQKPSHHNPAGRSDGRVIGDSAPSGAGRSDNEPLDRGHDSSSGSRPSDLQGDIKFKNHVSQSSGGLFTVSADNNVTDTVSYKEGSEYDRYSSDYKTLKEYYSNFGSIDRICEHARKLDEDLTVYVGEREPHMKNNTEDNIYTTSLPLFASTEPDYNNELKYMNKITIPRTYMVSYMDEFTEATMDYDILIPGRLQFRYIKEDEKTCRWICINQDIQR